MGLRNAYLLLREVEPLVEPLSLQETKLYLRVDGSDEDTLISDLITAVREQAEAYTRRAFITQDWLLALHDCGRAAVRLPYPPVQQILSVQVVSKTGVVTPVSSDTYYLMVSGESMAFDVIPLGHRVEIRYRAGYGDTAGDVPEPLRQGMLAHVAALYDTRGDLEQLPASVRRLYMPYRAIQL